MSKLKFNNNTYNFGEVSHNQLVRWKFPFEGKVEDIDNIKTSCHCTSVTKLEDGVIEGTFNVALGGGNSFVKNPLDIFKDITVWENDGKHTVVGEGEFKIQKLNKEKNKYVLRLQATVVRKG